MSFEGFCSSFRAVDADLLTAVKKSELIVMIWILFVLIDRNS